ncbi:hypothetical protein EVAR_37923_1 [Eumeta japonica]|uniref:Uncharacterized protein n=1 Tax=Eumeta variegata TaxID=151549 RepID=A0A4C1XEI0_EUMVA|nr:hypothetical protein EVAR_37923_1 [Eumeta japonica]
MRGHAFGYTARIKLEAVGESPAARSGDRLKQAETRHDSTLNASDPDIAHLLVENRGNCNRAVRMQNAPRMPST